MDKKLSLLIINGVNLNFLGIREPDIYGKADYKDLEDFLQILSRKYEIEIDCVQSNSEAEIVAEIQRAYMEQKDGIIINAGAYSHYSYAVYDAILSVSVPTIEVHISNPYSRKEEFRKKDVIAPACKGVISGLGFDSYRLAVDYFIHC